MFNLINLFYKIRYQIMYYILGSQALLDDLLQRKSNCVDLYKKTGEIAVVTGGARGIGIEIVKKLLQCDMTVIIGCRNTEMGEEAIKSVRSFGVRTGTAVVYHLNLKSLTSVKSFADQILKNYSQVHLLINNAGIMFVPYEETEGGFESHFMVNYLAHFLLTQLLLPAMEEGSSKTNRRIVNVTSCAYNVSPMIDFNDINMKNSYIAHAAYAQSKLAQVMFTLSLEARLKEKNSPVQVMAVHPGIVNTELFNGTFLKVVAPWLLTLLSKTPEQGAAGIVHAGISMDTEGKGGRYYSNCQSQPIHEIANNYEVQEKLFKFSMDAIKSFLSPPKKSSSGHA